MFGWAAMYIFLVAVASGVSPRLDAAATSLSISIVAPMQDDSPVHVVGLRYQEGHVTVALLNASDKPIRAVAIVGLAIVPPKCASGPTSLVDVGGYLTPLRIESHEKVFMLPSADPVFPIGVLVSEARRLGAAVLHFQVGVVEVDFADGTKWRPHEELPRAPFDSSLASADNGMCIDSAAVTAITKALEMTDGVRFDSTVEKPSYEENDRGSATPRLDFRCRLEKSKAVCPLPTWPPEPAEHK